eukprot:gnl/MRDRNA2_/MRDRNA2_205153_c0_seq1.p1 gnl/MRDRNA2_/MRDRNA2_205153_c0~~gnl/MRDRNA2_/MRDRNA2_205153_c0_seq1.p1  ORF type:complete len:192 (-),score=47.91 gnl/MRDRNA2_/MRDRNA2_205153_c0_seq1:32-559(-)
MFNKMGANHDGTLSPKEMEAILKELAEKGLILSTKTVEEVMKKADESQDGKIQLKEFQEWIRKECQARRENLLTLLNEGMKSDGMWLNDLTDRAFKSADKNGNGEINVDELVAYLTDVSKQLGEDPFIKQLIQQMVQQRDKGSDKKLQKPAFRAILKAIILKLYLYSGNTNGTSD